MVLLLLHAIVFLFRSGQLHTRLLMVLIFISPFVRSFVRSFHLQFLSTSHDTTVLRKCVEIVENVCIRTHIVCDRLLPFQLWFIVSAYLYHTKFESNIKEFQYFSHKISSLRNGLGKEDKHEDEDETGRAARAMERRTRKWYLRNTQNNSRIWFEITASVAKVAATTAAAAVAVARLLAILFRSNQIPNIINSDVTHNVTYKS